jgi:hypothetical protein
LALKINFSYSQSSDAKLLYIYDTTGVYDAVTNPGGWGGANVGVGLATSDKILIQKVGSSVSYEIQMFPTLPNILGTPYVIDSSMLGLGVDAQIEDGQYIITRDVIANSVSYRTTKRVFFISILKCCADTMLDAEAPGCSCEKGKLTNASILQYSIFTLKKAFKSQKFEKADQIYRYAQSLCKDKNCKNC